jgi:hypothetical protein
VLLPDSRSGLPAERNYYILWSYADITLAVVSDRWPRTESPGPNGREDYICWQTQDRKSLKRINQLVCCVTDDHIVVLQARDHY